MHFSGKKVILAPMAGITDRVFRRLCKENGADIVVSEMVSAEGLYHNCRATADILTLDNSERPAGIQLFGADPDHMARAAAFAEHHAHPDFIDLNAGCPVPKVVKKNGGAALLRDRALFEKIVSSMVRAVRVPVTVKIRSGWSTGEWVDVDFAKCAEQCGAAALTLHPRSQRMGFSGHSFWERIALVKNAVSIPVIGNGDVLSAQDALRMFDETGCDAVMIGRAAYGNPWIFGRVKAAISGAPAPEVTLRIKLSTSLEHLRRYREIFGDARAVGEMKKHVAWYITSVHDAARLRNRIFRAVSTAEIEDAVAEAFSFPPVLLPHSGV